LACGDVQAAKKDCNLQKYTQPLCHKINTLLKSLLDKPCQVSPIEETRPTL
jgi:hypothetical protein